MCIFTCVNLHIHLLQTLLSNLVQQRPGFFTSPQMNTQLRQRSVVTQSKGTGEDVGTLACEMAQVCLEMLARYTYSNLSTQPCRYVRVCAYVCVSMCVCMHMCGYCVVIAWLLNGYCVVIKWLLCGY